jgi:hypothetical protein
LKSHQEAVRTIDRDHGGDASRLLDIAQASLVFDRLAQVYDAFDLIQGQFEVVRVKDRFDRPVFGGYREVTVNLKGSDGHIMQMNLHLETALHERDQGRHVVIAEHAREIEEIATKQGRPLDRAERQRIEELSAQSEQIFHDAVATTEAGHSSASAPPPHHAELPRLAIVGTRPVKAVATADGGLDVLAFDWKTRKLARNMDYLTRIFLPDGDVDIVPQVDFSGALSKLGFIEDERPPPEDL